jgi:hypothetical protein
MNASIQATPSIKHTKKHLPKVQKHYLKMKLTYEEIKEKLIAQLNDLNAGVGEGNDGKLLIY